MELTRSFPDGRLVERDNLYRALPGGVELRKAGISARDGEGEGDTSGTSGNAAADSFTLAGHFCVFNQWTEICSWYEGEFLERIMPGSATKTIKENGSRVMCQYDHGYDEYVGSSQLGPFDVLTEDKVGVYYEVPLLDTDYNAERILPMLQGRLMSGEKRGSVLGASFRFRVLKDSWDMEPKVSAYNPKGLPERTITEFSLIEGGPVNCPAYEGATAGMRSLTDHYVDRKRSRTRSSAAGSTTAGTPNPDEPREHSTGPMSLAQANATLLLLRSRQ